MARGRMISKSLSTSMRFVSLEEVAGPLGEFCQVLYMLLVAHSDDFGRLQGDTQTVKLQVIPGSSRKFPEVESALNCLHEVGLILRYDARGAKFIQINQFEEHQEGLHKRTRSKFPEPPGNSRKFPEIPVQGKGTEEKGTEEKRIEQKGTVPEVPTGGCTPPAPVERPRPMPSSDGDAAAVWELFRTKALELRGSTLSLTCRPVEFGSLIDFVTRYPDPKKQAWLIHEFLTNPHRPIVSAPVSIGQLCKWAPWLEAQATAPAAENPRTAGNQAAADRVKAMLRQGSVLGLPSAGGDDDDGRT